MSKYKENFLNYASKLDAVTNSNGKITKYGMSIEIGRASCRERV